jgi:GcrA cell cycle regulator
MSDWTDDKVKLLATLFTEGWSRGQIATKLGVTKNAICGKIDRLGVNLQNFVTGSSGLERPPRTYEPQRVGRPEKQDRQAWRPSARPIAETAVADEDPSPPPIPPTGPIVLMDLRYDSCRWPINDGNPFLFCGKPRRENSPYCEEHRRKAHGLK